MILDVSVPINVVIDAGYLNLGRWRRGKFVSLDWPKAIDKFNCGMRKPRKISASTGFCFAETLSGERVSLANVLTEGRVVNFFVKSRYFDEPLLVRDPDLFEDADLLNLWGTVEELIEQIEFYEITASEYAIQPSVNVVKWRTPRTDADNFYRQSGSYLSVLEDENFVLFDGYVLDLGDDRRVGPCEVVDPAIIDGIDVLIKEGPFPQYKLLENDLSDVHQFGMLYRMNAFKMYSSGSSYMRALELLIRSCNSTTLAVQRPYEVLKAKSVAQRMKALVAYPWDWFTFDRAVEYLGDNIKVLYESKPSRYQNEDGSKCLHIRGMVYTGDVEESILGLIPYTENVNINSPVHVKTRAAFIKTLFLYKNYGFVGPRGSRHLLVNTPDAIGRFNESTYTVI